METDQQEIKKEAAWAISNLTVHAQPDHINFMVENNICQAMKKAFDIQESTTVMCCLEAMENILKCGSQHFMN